jgi:hypothetical protein
MYCTYLECNASTIKKIWDGHGPCYVAARMFVLETVESNEHCFEHKASTKLVAIPNYSRLCLNPYSAIIHRVPCPPTFKAPPNILSGNPYAVITHSVSCS